MLKVRIKTRVPEMGLARRFADGVLRLRCVCRGDRGVKALIDLKRPNGNTYVVVDEYECPLASRILASGVIVVSAEVSGDTAVWNVVCSEESYRKLMESVDCELISKESFSGEDVMTFREYALLKLAFENGFFDSPKGIRLEEIARILGVSKSTASETLRRGLKKALKTFFEYG